MSLSQPWTPIAGIPPLNELKSQKFHYGGYYHTWSKLLRVVPNGVDPDIAAILPHRFRRQVPIYGTSPRLLVTRSHDTPLELVLF